MMPKESTRRLEIIPDQKKTAKMELQNVVEQNKNGPNLNSREEIRTISKLKQIYSTRS